MRMGSYPPPFRCRLSCAVLRSALAPDQQKRGVRLGWKGFIDSLVVSLAGLVAGSVALIGFGVHSVIEVTASGAVPPRYATRRHTSITQASVLRCRWSAKPCSIAILCIRATECT
jgi:hypothetical protein